jgi:uncharacterized protein (DUF2336 family)
MIVRRFLQWVRTASADERAQATTELARSYLYADFSEQDLAGVESALIMMLDDPSPLVRGALAQALAFSENAPSSVILGLAADQPDVANWVLEFSPLLPDADLVDAVAIGCAESQAAIANRYELPASLAAAIAEVGSAEACLVLIENHTAEIAPFSLERIVARFGHLSAVRDALLARDIPASIRQGLVATLCQNLAGFVTGRHWVGPERARQMAVEACEKATVALAATAPYDDLPPLVRHLCDSGQLNIGLVLRALLSGNVAFFEVVLSELSGMPSARVGALVHDRRGTGFRAVYGRAGLPAPLYQAFHGAVEAAAEVGFTAGAAGATRLDRRLVERVLTRCAGEAAGKSETLMALLRRFAAEAARDEARLLCEELAVEEDIIAEAYVEEAYFAAGHDPADEPLTVGAAFDDADSADDWARDARSSEDDDVHRPDWFDRAA